MIALCGEHHHQADAGAFTLEQLRALKASAEGVRDVGARFNWMRQQLLAVVGGNFFLETPIPVLIHDIPVVMFTRDETGHWLLNLQMLSRTAEPRIAIAENFWLSQGAAADIECPPNGRLLAARYANGDRLKVEFIPDLDINRLRRRYPDARITESDLPVVPITVVEIEMVIAGTGIEFGPRTTNIAGATVANSLMSHCYAGIVVM
jgi:hypothetical protein